jgi:hypothetical protein
MSAPPLNGGTAADLLTSDIAGDRRYKVRTESPDGLYEGFRAMTVQSYTEANVKNGAQHALATYNPAIPAAPGFVDYVVITGALPISIKGRALQWDGAGIQLDTYRSPTYTGGTPVTYYNMSDIAQLAGLAQILGSPTVTDVGVKISPTRTLLGSTGQGNSVLSSAAKDADGLESILAPNTTYLFRTTSLHTATQRLSSFSTWYEGDLDLPLA